MNRWFSGGPVGAAVLLITAAHFVNLLPTSLNFPRFAFGDCGWPLSVDVLLSEGQKPVTDFGYFYGLLTLLIDRAVFAVFGRTPEAVVGIYGVCALATAFGAARTAAVLKLRPLPALYLVSCAALLTIPRGFPSPAHALEAALLMNAIADHAAGRLNRSLALVVVAVFVKPSLGYVYGLILLALILIGWPGGASRWRRLLPAAGIGAALVLLLAAVYGWEPLFRTQIPLDAMQAYRDAGFGFLFGSGQAFWWPDEPTFNYYGSGIPGIWLASSVVLLVSAGRLLRRYRDPAANVVLTCAGLHLLFVLVLFGNQWSWIYYPYILFVGTAVALNGWSPRTGGVLATVLIVLSIFGQAHWLWIGDHKARTLTHRDEATGWLYASPDEARDWAEVRVLAKTNRVLVLTRMGCPHVLAPELDGPRWWCLTKVTTNQAELERVRKQIGDANVIVSPAWHDNDLMRWEQFADVVRPFDPDHPVSETPFYKLYRRRPK